MKPTLSGVIWDCPCPRTTILGNRPGKPLVKERRRNPVADVVGNIQYSHPTRRLYQALELYLKSAVNLHPEITISLLHPGDLRISSLMNVL
jgi:hypothetical protein